MSSSSLFSRSDIRASVQFQGVIQGCPDHQWLIADALWEVDAGPTDAVSQRWLVVMHVSSAFRSAGDADASLSDAPGSGQSRRGSLRTLAYDRLTGWTASAATPADLAALIRYRYRNRANQSTPPEPHSPRPLARLRCSVDALPPGSDEPPRASEAA